MGCKAPFKNGGEGKGEGKGGKKKKSREGEDEERGAERIRSVTESVFPQGFE